MKKRAKSVGTFFAVLTIVFMVIMVSGCSKNTDTTDQAVSLEGRFTVDENTPSWKLDPKEDTTLTWYVNADWWNTDWGTDVVTKKIKEDLNLDVKFIVGDDTKLNTFFAGGDLPDIITIFDSSSRVAQSADQWAYPLNDLADKYDPYFYQVAKSDTLGWFQLSDGKTYGYPDYSNSQEDYDEGYIGAATAFVIRKDIYEALGEPRMNTQEEFISVLSEIKEKYPNLIPFGFNTMADSTGSLGATFQNFIGVPIENEDGSWYDRDMNPDYLSWVRTFNEAYNKGLISDDCFSDDSTANEDKMKTGKFATMMLAGTPHCSGALQIWMNSNPSAAYMAIDGPQSTVGNAPTLSQAGLSGWAVNYITKNCSDPIKAMELFTYLLTDDAGILTTYGVQGETYSLDENGKIQLLPDVKKMKESENDLFKEKYRLGEFCLFGHDRYLSYSSESIQSTAQMVKWGEGKLKPQFLIENINPDQGTAEARSLSAIDTKWITTLVSLIRAKDSSQFDQLLKGYQTFRETNNWDKILEVRNTKMDKNRHKLGLTDE